MKVVAPCRWEFGRKVRWHVPAVHAMEGPKIVFCEPGEEALYPSANGLHIVDRRDDSSRYGGHDTDRAFLDALRADVADRIEGAEWVEVDKGMPEERFVPEPTVRHLLSPDIVVCPRWREYGSEKNWPGWRALTAELQERGHTVHAAGAPDSSLEVPCTRAWDYDRFLDASIEMMRNARLVVATDAGLAHLAVLCGADLLVVTYEGKVAPGPVVNSSGNVAREEYWPVRLEEYYLSANHQNARIETVHGWRSVSAVVEAVETWTEAPTAA